MMQGLESMLLMLQLIAALLGVLTIVVVVGLGVVIHLLLRREPHRQSYSYRQ